MNEEEKFSALVSAALAAGITRREIADHCSCACTTVDRWAAGSSGPAAYVRESVAAWLEGRMKPTDNGSATRRSNVEE